MTRRALMATLIPGRGGVGAMRDLAVGLLAERGVEVVAGWYEGYSVAPQLSVRAYRIGSRRPGSAARRLEGTKEAWALGAWLPELEFMHSFPRRAWRELISGCDLHCVVSGNCLPGWLLERTGRPFFAWIASDWWGDRKDRVASYPAARRWLDRWLVRPVARRIERRVLRAGYVLALSQATRLELDRIAGRSVVRAVLPVPVDLERFRPRAGAVAQGRVGLAGRFDDPRKNIGLFLSGLAEARKSDAAITGVLIGASESPELLREIGRLGLAGSIEIAGDLPAELYAEQLRTLDSLVVTSHQEGLHISALEAMASGCPVVSTRCGGPEEFIVDGENGWLTEFDPQEIAGRIRRITRDRGERARMSTAARATVAREYSMDRVRDTFLAHFDAFVEASARAARR